MSNELIERLAREAGINFEPAGKADEGVDMWFGDQYLPDGALARFAALVAEHLATHVVASADALEHAERYGGSEAAGELDSAADRIRAAFPMPKDSDGKVACACTGACHETGICPLHGGRMGPSRAEREAITKQALEDPEVQTALKWWREIGAKRAAQGKKD